MIFLYCSTGRPIACVITIFSIELGQEQSVMVLGKILRGGGVGPSSFGRQQRLSEIIIEPIKNLGGWQDLGACAPSPAPA